MSRSVRRGFTCTDSEHTLFGILHHAPAVPVRRGSLAHRPGAGRAVAESAAESASATAAASTAASTRYVCASVRAPAASGVRPAAAICSSPRATAAQCGRPQGGSSHWAVCPVGPRAAPAPAAPAAPAATTPTTPNPSPIQLPAAEPHCAAAALGGPPAVRAAHPHRPVADARSSRGAGARPEPVRRRGFPLVRHKGPHSSCGDRLPWS